VEEKSFDSSSEVWVEHTAHNVSMLATNQGYLVNTNPGGGVSLIGIVGDVDRVQLSGDDDEDR